MESLCSDQSGASMSGMSGMSMSGMSAMSIVSSHSLKSSKSMMSNRPTEPSAKGSKDGPRAKLRAKSHFGTSTPVGQQDSTKALYETVNPYASFGAGISPLAAGESPVTSRGSTMKSDISPVVTSGKVGASTPPSQQSSEEDDYSLAMGPDVTTLLNRLNSQFGDFDTPTPTNSEAGTMSLKDHYSSQEYLMPGDESPLQMSAGTINLGFEDDADFDHASMRGFGPVKINRERKSSSSRSDSPGEVFHATFRNGLSPRQSPVKLEPGVTNPGFSRGSSPGYSRGSSSSPGYSRGSSSPDIRDPTRRSRASPASSQHSSRDSPHATRESPHEHIAMKILQDTVSHMTAVETMQRKAKLDHGRRNNKPSVGPLKSDPAHSAFASNFPKPGEGKQENYGAWKHMAPPQRKSSGSSTASIGESTSSDGPRSPNRMGRDSRLKSSSGEQIDKKSAVSPHGTPERKAPPPIRTKPPKEMYEDKIKDQKSGSVWDGFTGESHVQRSRTDSNSSDKVSSHTDQNRTPTNPNRTQANGSMMEPLDNVPSIVKPQAPGSRSSPGSSTLSRPQGPSISPSSSVSNSATLPMRKKMNYNPPADYLPGPHHNSSHSNSSFDSTDSSSVSVGPASVYFKHRPESAQSLNSMYSSTSSIPSVIHMPALKTNPMLNGNDISNGGIHHAGRGVNSVGSAPRHSSVAGDQLTEPNGSMIGNTTNSKLSAQNGNYIHQNGSVPHVAGANHVGDVNHNGAAHRGTEGGVTTAGTATAALSNSNYRTAPKPFAPKPFANGGIGWSKVNGPTSPRRPTSPVSPTSPRTPASPTTPNTRMRRIVYESSQC